MFNDSSDATSGNYPDSVAKLLLEEAYPHAAKSGTWEGEIALDRPDGRQLPVSQLVIAHRDEPEGEVAYFSTVARDISDRKAAEIAAQTAALREMNFANTLINSLPGIFFLIDEESRFLRWNSNLERALGYSYKQLRKMTLLQLADPEELWKMEKFSQDTRISGSSSIETSLLSQEGSRIPFLINGVRIEGFETDASILGTGIDISYRYQLERELRERATTDTLTGVFNRRKMEEEIELEIQKHARQSAPPISMAIFDIDRFKQVNDTFGHDAGDIVLKQVVDLVRQQLRDADMLARWGGEEFVILSAETSLKEMYVVAERVRTTIETHPVEHVGKVTISLGIGEYRAGETQQSLLKRIDDALYLAKQSGRNRTRIAES